MKSLWKPVVLLGTIVLAGPAAASQPTAADPSLADAAVPRVVYRSVFPASPRGLDSPLLDWKAANAEVGRFLRGHVDLLKWEQEVERAGKPASPPGVSRPVPTPVAPGHLHRSPP